MSELSEPCIPSTQVNIGGFTWTIYASTTAETIDQIEKVTRALVKRGYAAPRRPAFGARPPQKPLARPLIDSDGTPCCIHHVNTTTGKPARLKWRKLSDDRPGFWGCMCKAQNVPGEEINQRGYCDLKFDWPAESAPQNGAHR
jgi:hypothetical protein